MAAEKCKHMGMVDFEIEPRTPEGCEECLAAGAGWEHLRLCLTCGHVGCCDSSAGHHASIHAGEAGHPVVRSFQPGETWGWCYEDEVYIFPPLA
jgi:hypothetical protein